MLRGDGRANVRRIAELARTSVEDREAPWSVLVAFWGNGDASSVLKCLERGVIHCVYAMVENVPAHERDKICVRGLS